MGMAASQARFLQLTGRKTNIEYMGQQINQQRLALANQSAGLFEKMLTLEPPTPPSSLDDKYYQQGYTFNDPTDDMSKKISWMSAEETTAALASGDLTGTDTFNVVYVDTGGTNTPTNVASPTLTALFTGANSMIDDESNVSDGTTAQGVEAGQGANYAGLNIDDDLEALAAGMGIIPQEDTSTVVMRMVTIEHSIYDPDGSYQVVKEQVPAILEFDNLERLINITPISERLTYTGDYTAGSGAPTALDEFGINAGDEVVTGNIGNGEELTYSGVFDETAYNDDMNKYEFEKSAYDYQIERINIETAKIQKQDKSLELKMKQLDTEHKAISTEMDAVSKVIQKNIESTFKTFG